MPSDEEITLPDDLDVWEQLLNEQTALFQRTSSKNKDLQLRVEELERELSVWKAALKSADEEKKVLQRNVLKLERNIGSLKDNNPLILCLIDGDGNIFSSDLISLGQVGGRQAAMLLTKGLTDHITDVDSSCRGQIWLTVYCNKQGLLETLTGNGACTAEQFEAFVTGFNQASPLFSFVDVGFGKERADEKIKENLRVFTRFPQITKVFFGGAHDNGYISTLNHLQNEGHLHKVIILRGYKDLASELRSLNLPSLEIDGLFYKNRLQSVNKPYINRKPPTTINPQDFEKFRTKSASSTSSTSAPKNHSNSDKATRSLDPNLPLHRQKPPPCNFFYLADCKHGSKCRYGHDYYLSPSHIEELRESSSKWPCPYVNRGNLCPYDDACCMGHTCPKGRKCSFMKQGKCKFSGAHMHDSPDTGGRSHRSSRSHSRTPEISPLANSPAENTYNTALPSSPLSSPTASSGMYSVSIASDGRPIVTANGNGNESSSTSASTSTLLFRLGRRVNEGPEEDDYSGWYSEAS